MTADRDELRRALEGRLRRLTGETALLAVAWQELATAAAALAQARGGAGTAALGTDDVRYRVADEALLVASDSYRRAHDRAVAQERVVAMVHAEALRAHAEWVRARGAE
jgi:hypothetical protein